MYEKEKRSMATNDEWVQLKVDGDRLRKIEEETVRQELKEKNKDKNLKYEYKPNINILAGWLKNILIAMIFVDTKEENYMT